MARNLKDILKVVSSKVNSNELSMALSASNPFEVELDDKTFGEIENHIKGLTTLEEAKNNQDIFEALKPKIERAVESDLHKKFKAETLNGVEAELGKLGEKIGVKTTGKKWNEIISEIGSKAEGLSGDPDARVQTMTQEIEKLHKKVANITDARKTEKEEYENKLTSFQVDTILRGEIENAIPLAKPYQEKVVREGLITRFMDLAKTKSKVNLENGSLKFMNPSNPELELFNEDKSTKAGILDLIGEDAQPYIATAPPAGKETPPPAKTSVNETGYEPGSPMDAMRRQRLATFG